MTPLLPDDFVGKCVRHFAHACEKHPKFVNAITVSDLYEPALPLTDLIVRLCNSRDRVRRMIQTANLRVENLMDCKFDEFLVEYAKGNIPAAIEEAYDAIAVLMRTICVLEGKQELTKGVCE